MDIQKIQRTLGSTYIISLPELRADHKDQTRGMKVETTTLRDGNLIISNDISSLLPMKKQVDLTDMTGDGQAGNHRIPYCRPQYDRTGI